jgi:hypothetical protein
LEEGLAWNAVRRVSDADPFGSIRRSDGPLHNVSLALRFSGAMPPRIAVCGANCFPRRCQRARDGVPRPLAPEAFTQHPSDCGIAVACGLLEHEGDFLRPPWRPL